MGRKKQHINYLEYADSTLPQLLRQRWFRSFLVAGLSTLSMACMGSAVLPLAAAVAQTGIIVGIGSALIVCACNVFTSRMLLRQARYCGAADYESLGERVGGPAWQVFVEVSNWILLFGTIMGGIAQLGEASATAVRMVWCEPGSWLVGPTKYAEDGSYTDGGTVLIVLYMLILVVPWSLVKEMNELEYAGFVGYPIVLWMTISIIVRCIKLGFPSIRDGSLPIVGFTGLSNVASTVSTWAFAFYIQPVMMPYYSEMPPGNVGVSATTVCVMGVLLCTALVPYLCLGFFGAALWGPAAVDTGNVLLNDIYGEFNDGTVACPSRAQGALNICMTVYLAITLPPIEFALRHIVNTWISQLKKRFTCLRWIPKRNKGKGGWARNVVVSILNYAATTLLAIVFPSNSATALTITGATGVLLVSFLIPIVNHFILISGRARCQREARQVAAGSKGTDLEASPHGASAFKSSDAAVRVAAPKDSDLVKDSLVPVPGVPTGAAAAGGLGAVAAMNMLTSDDPDSYAYNAPLTNAFYARKYAKPLQYQKRSRTLLFWLWDVAVPVVVLVFGVFCSICTLLGVGQELAAA